MPQLTCPPGTHCDTQQCGQCIDNLTGIPSPVPPYYADPQGSGGNVPPKIPPGPGGLSDHDWYVQNIQSNPSKFDTGITEGQWIAWRQFWDDASKSFRNENVDAAGKAIGGTGFSKPVDCPEGTTKFNINQCLPPSDWRVATASPSTPAAAKASTAVPAPAPVIPNYSQLAYGPNDLQNALADMFNYRAGIFGTGNPHMSGATSRAPTGEDIAGVWLPGGGAWWGGSKELTDALAPFGKTFSTTPSPAVSAATVAQPKTGSQTCTGGQHWDATKNQCVADVSTQPVSNPVPFQGPLATALLGVGYPNNTVKF